MADDETKDQTPQEEEQNEQNEDKNQTNQETKQDSETSKKRDDNEETKDDKEEDEGHGSRNSQEEKRVSEKQVDGENSAISPNASASGNSETYQHESMDTVENNDSGSKQYNRNSTGQETNDERIISNNSVDNDTRNNTDNELANATENHDNNSKLEEDREEIDDSDGFNTSMAYETDQEPENKDGSASPAVDETDHMTDDSDGSETSEGDDTEHEPSSEGAQRPVGDEMEHTGQEQRDGSAGTKTPSYNETDEDEQPDAIGESDYNNGENIYSDENNEFRNETYDDDLQNQNDHDDGNASPLEETVTSGQPPASTTLGDVDGTGRKRETEEQTDVQMEEKVQDDINGENDPRELDAAEAQRASETQGEVNILILDNERVVSSTSGSRSESAQSFNDVPLPESSAEVEVVEDSPSAHTPRSPVIMVDNQNADDTEDSDMEQEYDGDRTKSRNSPPETSPHTEAPEITEGRNADSDELDGGHGDCIETDERNYPITEDNTKQIEAADQSVDNGHDTGAMSPERETVFDDQPDVAENNTDIEAKTADILYSSKDKESSLESTDDLDSPRVSTRKSETDSELERGQENQEEHEQDNSGDEDVESDDVRQEAEVSDRREDEEEARETDPDKTYFNKADDDETGEKSVDNDSDREHEEEKIEGSDRISDTSELELVEMDNEIANHRKHAEKEEMTDDETFPENEHKIEDDAEENNSQILTTDHTHAEKETDHKTRGLLSPEDDHQTQYDSANNESEADTSTDVSGTEGEKSHQVQVHRDSLAPEEYEEAMAEDTFETGSTTCTSANRNSGDRQSKRESLSSSSSSSSSTSSSSTSSSRESTPREPERDGQSRQEEQTATRSKTVEPVQSPKKKSDQRRVTQSAKPLLQKRQKTAVSRECSRPKTSKSCQAGRKRSRHAKRSSKSAGHSKAKVHPRSARKTKSARPRKQDEGYDEGNTEHGRSKQKDFFKEELRRLEKSLERESSKIHKPPVKKHIPYVFNSLEPYYNTHTAKYLIELPDEVRHSYVSRSTAAGLCDPWVDYEMDRHVLPRIDSRPVTRAQSKKGKRSPSKEEKEKRPPKEGSTRLPKFPVVTLEANELTNRQLFYNDVPELREELKQKYSTQAQKKIDEDYKRTKQDFYRMELDKMDKPNMRKAYFAYLQNTPGSRKAIYSCVRKSEKAAQ